MLKLNGNVLCVGAGSEQLPAIQTAQRMGLSVIALDGNTEAIALPFADRSIVMDVRNHEQVIQQAQQWQVRCVLPVPLGAILTTVGAVNDAMGLRGISKQAAQRCTDKLKMRQCLHSAGLPSPQFREVTDVNTLDQVIQSIGFPVVLKPRFGSGSRGIVVAQDEMELQHWLPWHLEQKGVLSYEESSIVEQVIFGTEVGIDGVVFDSRFALLLIRDKEITPLPFRLPYAHLTPTTLPISIQEKLQDMLQKAVDALGLDNCPVHADVIIPGDGEPVILDMSGRPSGFHISARMLPAATGIDAITQFICLALGSATNFQSNQQRGVVLRMLTAPEGTFHRIDGLADVAHMPGVVAVESFLKPGDRIEQRRTGATGYRVGYLISSGENRDEAEHLWLQAAQHLRFWVE